MMVANEQRTQAVYECRDLIKRRDGPLGGFELRVPKLRILPGEVILLSGPSGCGKSTLLDLLALALRPTAGSVFRFRPDQSEATELMVLWNRGDLDALGRLRGRHLGYVLQTGGLLPYLTVRENVELSCQLLGRAAEPTVTRLAERLGIVAQLDKRPAQLSVGERQRAAIARALAHRPSVLLADEPTASVDPLNAAAIIELLLELVRSTGVTAVIASHERHDALAGKVRVLGQRLERSGGLSRSLFWG
jgi:putative ABC transport system ATP-binding protein